jgi:hypothetical protein
VTVLDCNWYLGLGSSLPVTLSHGDRQDTLGAEESRLIQLIYQYSYLQMLDFLTTVAFLLNGVEEGNPLVRWAIVAAPSPLLGLLMVKLLAVGLGVYCWQTGKLRLLSKINIGFAALIAWNLVSLILKSSFQG